jgi:hypothetical protein
MDQETCTSRKSRKCCGSVPIFLLFLLGLTLNSTSVHGADPDTFPNDKGKNIVDHVARNLPVVEKPVPQQAGVSRPATQIWT